MGGAASGWREIEQGRTAAVELELLRGNNEATAHLGDAAWVLAQLKVLVSAVGRSRGALNG